MDYQKIYEEKKTTAKEIADQVMDGWVCASDIVASIPPAIMDALAERGEAGNLKDVRLYMLLDAEPFHLLRDKDVKGIKPISWFSGVGLRQAINEGRGDIMPCYYRDVPSLIEQYVEIDALFMRVSPMDRHGFFSPGVMGSNCEVLVRKAKHIYLEVNPNTPRAINGPIIHIGQVDALCEDDRPLPSVAPAKIDEISRKIGYMIADEIPNRATIQIGIGAVPEAVGVALRNKTDLGIHTELFTDGMVDLLECGAATNEYKPIYRGKSVATLALGTEKVYKYIDDNPAFVFKPVNYVNDPAIIAKHSDFISVNAALEVDFYGQVCAESIGSRHVSGTGGQADFVRGAISSQGGKSFIAFPSTAGGGTISRIKADLTPGALVSTGKNDVDHIVTEYGIAKLRGKPLSERCKALISIAHPKFRDELYFIARERGILI